MTQRFYASTDGWTKEDIVLHLNTFLFTNEGEYDFVRVSETDITDQLAQQFVEFMSTIDDDFDGEVSEEDISQNDDESVRIILDQIKKNRG